MLDNTKGGSREQSFQFSCQTIWHFSYLQTLEQFFDASRSVPHEGQVLQEFAFGAFREEEVLKVPVTVNGFC